MNNKSEKIIDRILGYLTLSIILLLLGLLFTDERGFRGFPFGWYHQPQYIRYEELIASFAALLALTICAAVISAIIGGIREPVMKEIKVKVPETNTLKPVVKSEKKEKASKEIVRKEVKVPELKTLVKTTDKSKSGNKQGSIQKFAIIALTLAVFGVSFFASLEDEDYDSGYDDDTYDYEYDLTDDTEFMSDTASEAVNLFCNGDYDSLSEIGDTSRIEDVLISDRYYYEQFDEPYMYSTDDAEQMVFRYILHSDDFDDEADWLLVGVLVETIYDEYPSENAKVTGMCVYDFQSYDDYQDYQDDPSRWITPAECHVIGKTDIDGSFILNVFDE